MLAVEYPQGSYSSAGVGGGVGGMHMDVYGQDQPSRIIVSYEVSASFDPRCSTADSCSVVKDRLQ